MAPDDTTRLRTPTDIIGYSYIERDEREEGEEGGT